jgi:hypothetical protein
MNKHDLAEFTDLLTTVSALYRTPLSRKSLGLYWDVLERLEWAEVKTGLQRHLIDPDTGQYFPKPADVTRHLKGTTEGQALKAWSKVDAAIQDVGSYMSIVFDDPIIHVVIDDMGGWVRLCHTLLKDLPFRANEFKKYYAGYVNRPLPHYPKQLRGLVARENDVHGHTQPPLLMGDPQRALTVFENGCEKLPPVHALNLSLASPFFSSLEKRVHE